jgi:peptidoglycan/LPS O-acetylase OafA/YrhL
VVTLTKGGKAMKDAGRIATVDWMKAIAIIAVVVTHTGVVPTPWLASSGLERFIRGPLVIFQVATFFAVAGFLAADAEVMTPSVLRKRLLRLVPPYLVASAAVIGFGFIAPTELGGALYILATGSAFGIYYFVFNLVISFFIVFVLTQISPKAVWFTLFGCLLWWAIAPLVVDASLSAKNLPSFWSFRDPTRYFPYFAGGWLARLHFGVLRSLWQRYERAIVVTAILLAVGYLSIADAVIGTPAGIPARAFYVLAFLAITTYCTKHSQGNPIIRFLSESSYTIYLYHMFFLLPVLPYLTDIVPLARIVVLTLAGLAGASAVALVGRLVLGERSRIIVGA